MNAHLGLFYFARAQQMAETLFPDPTARWSQELVEDGTFCTYLGKGIWCARGKVTPSDGSTFLRWEVIFYPDQLKPLAAHVGTTSVGDAQSAVKLSGHVPKSKGAANGEK